MLLYLTHLPLACEQDAFADFGQIVGFLSAGLVFTTSSVNSLVYSPVAPFEAAAAGYILLSMITVRHSPTPACQAVHV